MVKCPRCEGFMVKDCIYNVDGQFLEIEMARCVNCGNIVDLTIPQLSKEKIGTMSTKAEPVAV
jgi:transcription elongation factor Elf1